MGAVQRLFVVTRDDKMISKEVTERRVGIEDLHNKTACIEAQMWSIDAAGKERRKIDLKKQQVISEI